MPSAADRAECGGGFPRIYTAEWRGSAVLTCDEVCVDAIRPADGHVAVVFPLHTNAGLSEAGAGLPHRPLLITVCFTSLMAILFQAGSTDLPGLVIQSAMPQARAGGGDLLKSALEVIVPDHHIAALHCCDLCLVVCDGALPHSQHHPVSYLSLQLQKASLVSI
jgi:hypothetical protein